jgi:hypothetical protein
VKLNDLLHFQEFVLYLVLFCRCGAYQNKTDCHQLRLMECNYSTVLNYIVSIASTRIHHGKRKKGDGNHPKCT